MILQDITGRKKPEQFFGESLFTNLRLLAGHAFEARIYAENVAKGFLPATGVLNHYRPVAVSSSGAVQDCV